MNKINKIVINVLILLMLTACAGTSKEVPVAGIMEVNLTLEGGSGRASVEPHSTMRVDGDSKIVTLTWSSPNYDYMIVDGTKYLPVNTEGNSVFEIPVICIGEPFTVIGDTVAMSTPHEIEYQLTVTVVDNDKSASASKHEDDSSQLTETVNDNNAIVHKWINANLQDEEALQLQYAKKMKIYSYADSNYIININDADYYLLTSNKDDFEKSIPKEITIIPFQPEKIYVVGTGSMDYFVALEEISNVKYSSLQEGSWDIASVNEAMHDGSIQYAGKYSAPDFELLKAKGCDFIVENTMITHSPEVLLQLQNLNFPVLIDNSIYEESILGRMEWVKLYGLISGKYDKACEVFDKQAKIISDINCEEIEENNKKKIGFFAITSQGTVTIRRSEDNICDIIRLAGGKYGFEDLAGNNGTGSTTVQMEEFINAARDCDILIYNSTISGEIASKDDLSKKCELIKKCKAYENGEIYCTTKGFYQAVMELGNVTLDVSKIITGQDDLTYLVKIK